MDKEKLKQKLIDIGACTGTVAATGLVLWAILAITMPIDDKLAIKRKETEDFSNSNKYSISDLIIYKDHKDETQILLGNVPNTKMYYDINEKEYCKIIKTKNANGKIVNLIFTNDVNTLVGAISSKEYKSFYSESEIEELENSINTRTRKLS